MVSRVGERIEVKCQEPTPLLAHFSPSFPSLPPSNMSGYSSPGVSCTFPSTGVLLIELNRAPVNAFNTQLWLSVKSVFDHASEDSEVRSIVFGSKLDKGFTAGLDLM